MNCTDSVAAAGVSLPPMAEIKPLRALHYDLEVTGPLQDLATPPYDVIDPVQREMLATRSPYNAVHVDLPEGGEDVYDTAAALPPIPEDSARRAGKLPPTPKSAPGAKSPGEARARLAAHHNAGLLADHGPVVAGTSLSAAVDAMEELEETARLYLLLHGRPTRYLTPEQIADLNKRFPPPG